MPAKKYIVDLTAEERENLLKLISSGNASARKLTRARILLKADEGLKDKEIVAALNTSRCTVERIRQRFVDGNLDKALNEDPRPGQRPKLDGKAEAHLIASTARQKYVHSLPVAVRDRKYGQRRHCPYIAAVIRRDAQRRVRWMKPLLNLGLLPPTCTSAILTTVSGSGNNIKQFLPPDCGEGVSFCRWAGSSQLLFIGPVEVENLGSVGGKFDIETFPYHLIARPQIISFFQRVIQTPVLPGDASPGIQLDNALRPITGEVHHD